VRSEFYDEVQDTERQVRPDYGVSVDGAITGYVEVKAPGKSIDPASFRGHDKTQWERQRDLPNLLYTNGTDWRLYRDGEQAGDALSFSGGELAVAGTGLTPPPAFEALATNFLRWRPAPITSVGALVRAVAPLTRLLRGEVLDQLHAERRAIVGGAAEYEQPFLGLAHEWRALLFPHADDATFADGYAQTVTFALLMARTEGIAVTGVSLPQIGEELKADHSLMGRALQLLTIDVAVDFRVTLNLLTRVIGAVDWPRIRAGRRDLYLHLYEHFLEEYDNELRKASGSYYTPREVVEQMVRLTEDALATRLGKASGFADPSVLTIDPAMGTGTYLHTILDTVAERVLETDGPGAVGGALASVAANTVGFELQMGPYTVAELRLTDLLQRHTTPNGARPRLFVTDTLDDPYAAQAQLGGGLAMIAASRRRANEIKADANVTVVIGNPPYRERAEGLGGWVESGTQTNGKQSAAILDDFRDPATSRHAHNLKNLYVYFWRWATWKVFESTPQLPDGDAGIVCFISTSGYVRGPGFTGMRRYLREWASEGWVIDVTPEGQTPEIPTRIFPGVRQPLAIALFVRRSDETPDNPAVIRHRVITGSQDEKFSQLAAIALDDDGWDLARTGWTAPLTAAAEGSWDEWPAVNDLLPWSSPGVTGNRRWPYAPSRSILEARWAALRSEPNADRAAELFKQTGDRTLKSVVPTLPGISGTGLSVPLCDSEARIPAAVRVAQRAFDRQWIIPDRRLLDRPRPDLWAALQPDQVFIIEQHDEALSGGPALLFSAVLPDLHYFNGRGGRVLPALHADGSANAAPGFLATLSELTNLPLTSADLVAYMAAVTAHPGYVHRFSDQLRTPGVRVPISAVRDIWERAIEVGREVVWCHTYGERSAEGHPGAVRFSANDPRRILALTAITELPDEISYDEESRTLRLGNGTFGPVPPEVWEYATGGRRVIKSWFDYRKKNPGGRRTSPLDDIGATRWDPEWTSELLDLLSVLTRLTELEAMQDDLLDAVLAGGLLSRNELADLGVQWPTAPADRRPRVAATADTPDGLDFGSLK
jgi:hypothetical protein